MDYPRGEIADSSKVTSLTRNVAVFRTGLHSLHSGVNDLESKFPEEAHSVEHFDVNGIYGQVAVKLD